MTANSPSPSRTSPSRRRMVISPLTTKNISSSVSCLCQTKSPRNLTSLTYASLTSPAIFGLQCSVKSPNFSDKLTFSIIFLSLSLILSVERAQDGARGCPVAAAGRDLERQAAEVVDPRPDRAQVEPLDDDDAGREQREVRLELFRAEPLDRKVVEPDEHHARRDERAGRRGLGVGEVLAELPARVFPDGGVGGLEEEA